MSIPSSHRPIIPKIIQITQQEDGTYQIIFEPPNLVHINSCLLINKLSLQKGIKSICPNCYKDEISIHGGERLSKDVYVNITAVCNSCRFTLQGGKRLRAYNYEFSTQK